MPIQRRLSSVPPGEGTTDALSFRAARRRARRKSWLRTHLVELCLFSPVIAGFGRKLVPGQPSAIRVAGAGVVLVALVLMLGTTRRAPTWVRLPIAIWALFEAAYLVPTLLYDLKMGVAAALIYLVPLALTGMAYANYRDDAFIERLATWFGRLALALFPLALVVAVFGNEVLPVWLSPSEEAMELGLGTSKGLFPAPSLLFATPTELAYAMLPATYLALAALESQRRRGIRRAQMWAYALAATLIIYLCGRRGVFLAVLPGYALALVSGRRLTLRRFVPIGLISAAIVLIDRYSFVMTRQFQYRTDVYSEIGVARRISDIFWRITAHWMDLKPLGSFLGYSGPLSEPFGVELADPVVEVGAASVVADTGIAGLVLLVIVFYMLLVGLWRRSRKPKLHDVRQLLLFMLMSFVLYMLKSLRVLTSVTPTHLLFWATPGIAAAIIVGARYPGRPGKAAGEAPGRIEAPVRAAGGASRPSTDGPTPDRPSRQVPDGGAVDEGTDAIVEPCESTGVSDSE